LAKEKPSDASIDTGTVLLISDKGQSISEDEASNAGDAMDMDDSPHFPDLTMNATQMNTMNDDYAGDLVEPTRKVEKVFQEST
jgi:hypothetical protein